MVHRSRRQARRGPSRPRVALAAVLAVAALVALPATGASASHRDAGPGVRGAIFVGNNWEGTADILLPHGDFPRVARLNIIPDIQQRMAEILANPVRLAYFLGIRMAVGEGHDQFVDDMFSTPDGRLLIVSRPSLADVVGIEIATGEIAWRFVVDGQRSDHMGISPDGEQVAVSASTGNVVHILDSETGEEIGGFESGDSPHENNYSADGERIYHASIGLVYTPLDQPALDTTKGERWFEIVDAGKATDDDPDSDPIIERIDMGEKLAEAGYPNMSSAVRPMALSPNEGRVYFQVSFFHGFVEYDFSGERVTRVASLPIAEHVQDLPREQYLLDSAHHGIAMNAKGTRLCVAGTMSDYAAIVSRKSFEYKLIQRPEGAKPYWSTTSADGRHCYVSWSGIDQISVISYAKKEEIARVHVGDTGDDPAGGQPAHPQRVRNGIVRADWLRARR